MTIYKRKSHRTNKCSEYPLFHQKRDCEAQWELKPFLLLVSGNCSLGNQYKPGIVQIGQ